MAKGSILVLNSELSGLNKYLLNALEEKGWRLTVTAVPRCGICKYIAAARTFSGDIGQWKRQARELRSKLQKTPWVFMRRTRIAERHVRHNLAGVDLILQISGLFMPARDLSRLSVPYVLYTDYTTKLAEQYPPWLPFQSQLARWYALEKILYGSAAAILPSSENTRQSFIRDYDVDAKRVTSVGCGVTFDALPGAPKSYDGKTILFVGKEFTRKGGHVLLDAFRTVRARVPDARLLIVGPEPEELQVVMPGVEVLGRIRDRDHLQTLFAAASVFALPSLCEPFGLVSLEAMAHRLPCVGTRVDAMAEIIQDEVTGYLVPPNDSGALAQRLVDLLGDVERAAVMGTAGFAYLSANFTWQHVADRIDKALEAVLGRRD